MAVAATPLAAKSACMAGKASCSIESPSMSTFAGGARAGAPSGAGAPASALVDRATSGAATTARAPACPPTTTADATMSTTAVATTPSVAGTARCQRWWRMGCSSRW